MNRQQKQLKVILIGDSCIDEYHYGVADRLSPEAPVPVFKPEMIDTKAGMAGNVYNNLTNLGVSVITYFGPNSLKIRLIDRKSNHHIVRIDRDEKTTPLSPDTYFPSDVDAIVISDYNKGFVSYELIEFFQNNFNIPIFIDTKKTDLERFSRCFIKINQKEYESRISEPKNAIVTYGDSHVLYQNKRFEVPKVPTFDVCGAGDTFLSSLTYKYLLTKNMDESIKFAIKASSITVQHVGVYAPTLEEIR